MCSGGWPLTLKSNSTVWNIWKCKIKSLMVNKMMKKKEKWLSGHRRPLFLLPDASLSWQSYRASEAAMGRETMRREKRFREGQMASWPQANDQHRLFRKRLLAFSRRLRDGLNNFTRRRSWNLCWYYSLPPTCDWQQGSDASLVCCSVCVFST